MAPVDVETLLTMASDRTERGRAALLDAVSELFLEADERFSDAESRLVSEVLRLLIRDVETAVRKSLAERLAHHAAAPRDLVVELARDEIDVAYPILRNSPVLLDRDLIAVVRERTRDHQLAIAKREAISPAVSEALVETGDQGVIATLLENGGAKLAMTTLEYVVEQSRLAEVYHKPLLARRDLPPLLARRMYWWVAAALRQHILDRYRIDQAELDQAMEETVRQAMRSLTLDNRQDAVAQLADEIWRTQTVTPKGMIQILREGEVRLFKALFAKTTGFAIELVRSFLREEGGRGLAIACKACGIDKSDFISLFLLGRQARPGNKVVDPRELSQAVALYDRIDAETAEAIAQAWRRDPDYVKAIREVAETLERAH